MTEVEYGGRGHRTRLRNDRENQLVCLGVPPAPVYKGARGGGRPALLARQGGVLLLVGVGLLLRPPLGRPHPPLDPLYTEAGGTLEHTS